MRTVAQHGTPFQRDISVTEIGLDGFSRQAKRAFYGALVDIQADDARRALRHFRRGHFGSVAQSNREQFRSGLESHRFAAVEHQMTARLLKRGFKKVVAERENIARLRCNGSSGLLLLWKNHGLSLDCCGCEQQAEHQHCYSSRHTFSTISIVFHF